MSMQTQQQTLAELSVLIPASERVNAFEHQIADDYVPHDWDGPQVGKRLTEAFKTLAKLPGLRLTSNSGYWPNYQYEWGDLLAQREAELQDLELQVYLANRVRVRPTSREIGHMEFAVVWPARYLLSRPIVMRIVLLCASHRARELEDETIARRLRQHPVRLRRLNRLGLDLIAIGLRRDQVAVF